MSGYFSNRLKPITLAVAQALTILALLWWVLNLGDANLTVPFSYSGDTLWFLVPIKSLIDNGNPYLVSSLSAPFDLSAAAFASMTNFDWAVMKLMSPITEGPGHLLNLFWIATVVVTGWLGAFSFRLLGVRRVWLCVLLGISYALLPFTFLRNVMHISLVYYTVAPICVLAVHLMMGLPLGTRRAVMVVGFVALVVQGFGYLYYSFFSVLLLGFAAIVGWLRTRQGRPLKVGAWAIGVVLAASSVNLAPTFWSWATFGKPPDIEYKIPAEAEIYGLKLRRLLVPHPDNMLPLLSSWGKSDARAKFPNENENTTARLGLLGAIGFIVLFVRIFVALTVRAQAKTATFDALAALTLFCLLLTTVGGLGAILNQMVADFRAYNRFSVFIAFLSLAGLALWVESLLDTTQSRVNYAFFLLALGVAFVVSIYDQTLDAKYLVDRRPSDEAAARHERAFVDALEGILPVGSAVFQLPVTTFPPDAGQGHMLTYDHARAYLASSTLRWSWPSFSQRHRAWQTSIVGLEGDELAPPLVLSGFRAVWIDRYGYDDRGERVIAGLKQAGAVEILVGESPRYVVMDLAEVERNLRRKWSDLEFDKRRTSLLGRPSMEWKSGFYGPEVTNSGMPYRWSKQESHLELRNWMDKPWQGDLVFEVAAGNPGQVKVSGAGASVSVAVSHEPTAVRLPLTIPPKEKLTFDLRSNTGPIALPPGEHRDLHFYVLAPTLEPR